MIAHNQTAKLHTGSLEPMRGIIPQLNLGIIVFKIRTVGISPQIAPFSDDGISQIPVMAFIRIGKHHHTAQLATHLTIGAECRRTVDFGVHIHRGMGTGGKRRTYAHTFHDFGIMPYIYRAIIDIENHTFEFGPLLYKQFRRAVGKNRIADKTAGIGQRTGNTTGCKNPEILFHFTAVLPKNVIRSIYPNILFPIKRRFQKMSGFEIGAGS